MSPDVDRVPVPTNGHGPHSTAETARLAGADDLRPPDAGEPSDEDLATAFSPKQLAVGFGIVASLVLVLAGWARRRRAGG